MNKNNRQHKDIRTIWGTILCVLGVVIVLGNLTVIYRSAQHQAEELGSARLQQISNQMQKTLDESKLMLLRFASDVEIMTERGADEDELMSYLKSQSRIFKDESENTLMNAYICTSDWILVSDSSVPGNYIISTREWYHDTLENGIDNIYISAPYLDAFTGRMCFTLAVLLPDGKTIASIDYDLSRIQECVEEINRENDGEALVVSRKGVVVGYTDNGQAGRKIENVLPQYVDVYTRLLNEQNDNLVVDAEIDGRTCKVFCNRSGEWLMIYKTGRATLLQREYLWIWISIVLNILLFLTMFLFFLASNRSARRAKEALRGKEEFLEGLSASLREPLTRIMNESAAPAGSKERRSSMRNIRESAEVLSGMMNNLFFYKNVKSERRKKEEKRQSDQASFTLTTGARNGIMAVMIVTMLVAIAFTGFVLEGWGKDRMEREVDSYNYQLENWTNNQLKTMNMFVDTIAANPSVIDDYDFAVEYLDRIVRNYPEISAAYIARPGNEHEMTMNNGWVPNSDYIVAERQWYVDTVNSENGFSVSTPYIDARTGLYCMTFSRVVYDSVTGGELGVFALDFYIGNLTSIMESSYSSNGYAFLVDNSNVIVNHPNDAYQMASYKNTSIVGTEYDSVLNSNDIKYIRDYDGRLKLCISRTENTTGFTVISVKDFYTIYGFVLASGSLFIILLGVCIVLLYNLIMRMIRWQEEVRHKLTAEAERASNADRAKSSFLAQMSHEIRTPINAVLGMNEMILREAKDEAVLEYASNAYNAGKALLSIINDILDISKIEAGKLEIVNEDYDIYSLVNDCRNMTADRAQKKGLEFIYTVDETLPVKLSGDMFHIRQIVVNFLTNSIKYTDEGSITLAFSGRTDDDGFSLVASVTDTGIGLTEESMEKLFTSFQRFDLKRNQSVEGTGLGLSICKQLAELMGGSVEVESIYGKGSTFRCIIPQTIVDEAPIGKMTFDYRREQNVGKNDRIFTANDARLLVVDDVDMNLVVFRSLLKGHELNIDEATSGMQCLDMIQKQKYDLIFMDHMMPGMDGMETFARMHDTEHLNNDTPVVMLTANAISGEKEKYMDAGFASYLTKPIISEKLEETLLQFLPEEKIKWENAPKEGITKDDAEKGDVPPAEDNIRDVPDGFDVIDVKLGLSYTGNDENAYCTILGSYVEKGDANLADIERLCADAAWTDYVTRVHALKSTSLTIGARTLSENARELELAGKAGEYETIKDKNAGLLEAYRKVLEEGRRLLERYKNDMDDKDKTNANDGHGDVHEISEITDEELSSIMQMITDAAVAFDNDAIIEACDSLSQHSYKGILLSEHFEKVRKAAAGFECEEAAELAKSVYEKIKNRS